MNELFSAANSECGLLQRLSGNPLRTSRNQKRKSKAHAKNPQNFSLRRRLCVKIFAFFAPN